MKLNFAISVPLSSIQLLILHISFPVFFWATFPNWKLAAERVKIVCHEDQKPSVPNSSPCLIGCLTNGKLVCNQLLICCMLLLVRRIRNNIHYIVVLLDFSRPSTRLGGPPLRQSSTQTIIFLLSFRAYEYGDTYVIFIMMRALVITRSANVIKTVLVDGAPKDFHKSLMVPVRYLFGQR